MGIIQTGETKESKPRRNLLKTTVPVSPGDKSWPNQATNCSSLQRVVGSRALYPQRWAAPPQGQALGGHRENTSSHLRGWTIFTVSHLAPSPTLILTMPHLSFLWTAKNLPAPSTTFHHSNYGMWQAWPALSGPMA